MNAVTSQQAPQKTFRDLITSDGYKNQLAQALPKGLTADRMVRVVLTAINKTPKLLECSKESLWLSVLNCASLGLFPDALGRAYLVPYGKECQLIIGYKGLIDLAYRSERVASIQLVIVREGDKFKRQPLSNPPIVHEINDAQGDAFRRMTHVYSVVYLTGCATPSVDVMSLREVQDIQARSKSGKSGPWVTDFEEMAKKTVFRRHSKVLPMSAELAQALEQDADGQQLDIPTPANRFAQAKPADSQVQQEPQITVEMCMKLAESLPDELILDLLAKYQIHSISAVEAGDIAQLHADLVKGKA